MPLRTLRSGEIFHRFFLCAAMPRTDGEAPFFFRGFFFAGKKNKLVTRECIATYMTE